MTGQEGISMSDAIRWPTKTRDIHNHHMDSTIWDELEFRDDDIIIGTYAKAGTTWTQQIIGQLVFNGDPAISAHDYSPWLDIRIMPKEDKLGMMEAQTNRRFIKTHLPLDALTFHPPAKYLYVARDFPDIVWSLHNHLHHANDLFYEMFNETPGLVGPKLPRPPADVYEFWKLMLHGEYPMWSFWENIRTWWEFRHLPNIRLVHFNDLKKDMAGEIRAMAQFLDMTIDESRWPAIVEHCSFDWMKANADRVVPMAGDVFEGGARTFINKGSNQRWKDVLSDADIAEYEAIARKALGDECLQWLRYGKAQ